MKIIILSYSQVMASSFLFYGFLTGSFILISDDAREKAWEEWLSSPANHLKDYKDEIVKHLQAIANSFSEDMLNVAAHELEDSETWKMSDHFRNWFQSNWLSQAKVSLKDCQWFYDEVQLHVIFSDTVFPSENDSVFVWRNSTVLIEGLFFKIVTVVYDNNA